MKSSIAIGKWTTAFFLSAILLGVAWGQDTIPQISVIPAPPGAQAADQGRENVNGGVPEDWNTLKIDGTLKYADPMPPLKGEFPGFSREIVQLTWRPWDIIDLYVLKPAGIKNPPVILYLYSFPSNTDRFKDNDFARIVTKNGFAAVGFVSALTGPRYHDRPMREWFVTDLQEAMATSVHDVQLILNYLTKRGDLDMSRVGMFGDGSGASIAIMAASVDPRIKALDLFDAWGDWPEWIAHSSLIKSDEERAAYLKPDFLKKVAKVDPLKYLPQLKTQQIRLQYLETDTVTPKTARERMEAAAPPGAKNLSYEDSKAFLKSVGSAEKMFDWLQEQVVTVVAADAAGSETASTPSVQRASDKKNQ